ncbi:MAG: ABC transporter permease [Coprococcus sp.]
MLKMLKYEWRKNILSVLIVLGVYAALEIYYLIACYGLESRSHASISMSLLFLAASFSYIFVLLYGIISYSSDLKNKSGYLVFMAPISSFKIIGAKLLSTLVTGVLLLVAICGLIFLNYNIACAQFGLDSIIDVGTELLSMFGYSFSSILISILFFVFTFLLEFYMIVTVGYLAVSISSTVLQNKKGKGFVSVLLFIVIIVLVSIVSNHLPVINSIDNTTFANQLLRNTPELIWMIIITLSGYIGSSLLLEKKISL